MLLLTTLYIGSSRYVSVLDLFTDVIFAKELKAKGHPNYHTFAVVILILPFAALYLLVGYVFVEKYSKMKESRTQLILLWLFLGWFVIAMLNHCPENSLRIYIYIYIHIHNNAYFI